MLAKPHGTRVLGERHVLTCTNTFGAATVVGDICQTNETLGTSHSIEAAATGAAVLGIALEAVANAATLDVDRIRPGDRFWVYISAGTMSATELGKYGDIVNDASITLTESNNDVRLMGWDGATTNYAIVEFTSPESATPTLAI